VCDTWKIADYLGIINWAKHESDYKMTMQAFAGVLGNQLVKNAAAYGRPTQRFFSSSISQLFTPNTQDYAFKHHRDLIHI
jgi:hypothetical protein